MSPLARLTLARELGGPESWGSQAVFSLGGKARGGADRAAIITAVRGARNDICHGQRSTWRRPLTTDTEGTGSAYPEDYEIERSYLTLAFRGAELDPQDVTRGLGISPTLSITASESIVPREGVWLRQFDMSGFSTLRELVDTLIAEVRAPSVVWRVLAAKAKITLAGSLYPGNWNQGTTLSARQLRWIGAREVELAIDVHSWTNPSSMDIEPWR